MRQHDPYRLAHRAGKMSDAGIGRDDEIEHRHQPRRFGKIFVSTRSIQDRDFVGHFFQLFRRFALLQRNPEDALHTKQRQQGYQLHGSAPVSSVAWISSPCHPHTQQFAVHVAELRLLFRS